MIPARQPTLSEKLLSAMFRSMPIKHGAHRLLDKLRPTRWVRGSPIVAVPYAGHCLEIDISDLVGWHFFIMRHFDPEITEVLCQFSDRDDVFWDIGANKGTCAFQMASALPGCSIIAIEPQPTLQDLLANNLRLVAAGRHERFAVGIGESPGQFELLVPRGNTGRATLTLQDFHEPCDKQIITVITADALKNRSQYGWPTLVKIDVEGFEASVIRSLSPAFRSRAVRCCVFECHRGQEPVFDELKALIEALGYRFYAIAKTPFTTGLHPAEHLVRGSTDYAIVRDDLLGIVRDVH